MYYRNIHVYTTTGTLGKLKGQVLRVEANFHVLNGMYSQSEDGMQAAQTSTEFDPDVISEKAAINFTELCCQQTAFMSGRGNIKEDIQTIKASKFKCHAALQYTLIINVKFRFQCR